MLGESQCEGGYYDGDDHDPNSSSIDYRGSGVDNDDDDDDADADFVVKSGAVETERNEDRTRHGESIDPHSPFKHDDDSDAASAGGGSRGGDIPCKPAVSPLLRVGKPRQFDPSSAHDEWSGADVTHNVVQSDRDVDAVDKLLIGSSVMSTGTVGTSEGLTPGQTYPNSSSLFLGRSRTGPSSVLGSSNYSAMGSGAGERVGAAGVGAGGVSMLDSTDMGVSRDGHRSFRRRQLQVLSRPLQAPPMRILLMSVGTRYRMCNLHSVAWRTDVLLPCFS